jgi:hypothetical protein
MPDRSDKVERLNEEAGQYELPYISKSRVMEWIKNPEHFRLSYLEDVEEPETGAMVRGTRIHETFEHYYEQVLVSGAHLDPDNSAALPENRQQWADFVVPYVSNFFKWEYLRWASVEDRDDYLPVAIEEEHWRDPILGLEGEPEWMGLADVILPAASIDDVADDEGVVIVDFKTGKVPRRRYREEGIYTELSYYEILFEDKYDVAAVGAYYPKEDELLIRPSKYKRSARQSVFEAVTAMVSAVNDYDGSQQFEAKEGPLCRWSFDDDDESSLYDACEQCSWAEPARREASFRDLVSSGCSNSEIAEQLGTSENAVNYWRRKL